MQSCLKNRVIEDKKGGIIGLKLLFREICDMPKWRPVGYLPIRCDSTIVVVVSILINFYAIEAIFFGYIRQDFIHAKRMAAGAFSLLPTT